MAKTSSVLNKDFEYWSHDFVKVICLAHKVSFKIGLFWLKYGNIKIFKMAGIRHLEFLISNFFHYYSGQILRLRTKFHANLITRCRVMSKNDILQYGAWQPFWSRKFEFFEIFSLQLQSYSACKISSKSDYIPLRYAATTISLLYRRLSAVWDLWWRQGGPKKTKPHTFVHIFAKYWPMENL